MAITLILFGQLVDITGSTTLMVEDAGDTDRLTQYLHQHFPALRDVKYAIAVDKKIIRENTSLNNGAIVALLPPFSGG
jgi:molybdopterin synthase sulfur carrier subunit